MMKKMLVLLMAVLPLIGHAQFSAGKWVNYHRFSVESAQNVIDTDSKVYYLATNSLYCFDKATATTTALGVNNGLSGGILKNIFFNHDKNFLVVVYDDSNIDIVKADGSVVNVPNIKDAVMHRATTINDVTFGAGNIYVATGFGYAVISDSTFEMTTARVLNYDVTSVAVVGKWLMISCLENTNFLYCPVDDVPELAAQYKHTYFFDGKICPVDDHTFLFAQDRYTHHAILRFTIDDNGSGKLTFTSTTEVDGVTPTNIQKTKTGFIANFFSEGYYYTFDAAGQNPTKVTGGQALFSCAPDGDGTLWSVTDKGLHSSANQAAYYTPQAISLKGSPWWMGYNKKVHKLYLMATSDNAVLSSAYIDALYEANTFDGTEWKSANPTGTVGTQGWYWPVFDPYDDTDTYYIGTRLNGVFKVTDNEVTTIFTAKNSPYVARKPGIQFDSQGNLWMVHSSLSNTVPVKVLTKDKLHSGSFTATDWTVYQVPDVTTTNSFKRSCFDITKGGSNIKAFSTGDWKNPLILWKNDADVTSKKFESRTYSSLPSNTGSAVTWNYIYDIKADLSGGIVLGTTAGVTYFKGDDAFNSSFAVQQCPDLATTVYCLAIDTLNRKWVGTDGDGIYVVDPECTTVLKHYTSGNSSLLSNVVWNLCCNTDNNSMFVVTPLGVQQYFSDYVTAAENYDNVAITPNPVRPDFTGFVTISGLMSNSLVVIKDSNGNVVKRLQSDGGTAIWDGCDSKGERLATGAYGVFAAQSEAKLPAKPLTKIMLIK